LLQNLAERGADQWLSPEGVKSFLAACLLHDLGHFPYTHSLKELPLASHESLTGAIILKEPMKTLVHDTGANPEFTAAIVDKELEGSETELLFYRKLLSGALDPDKLDYLNRDARYCGVPYGAQDVDFIFSRLIPHKERGADIDSRLIPNVESVLFSKYLMYRTVYWHRQVRSATAMVKKAMINGLESGRISDGELFDLDDQSLFSLLREKTANPLAEAVRQGRIFATAAEIPLIPEQFKADMATLREISFRSRLEDQLAATFRSRGIQLKEEDLIIDLPEPVSFETGLYVVDEGRYFEASSSAFKSEVISSFIQTLYTLRIYVNQNFKQSIKTMPRLLDILYDSIRIINRGI
jgi:HD superfamily phosphohydrolase